MRKFLIAFFALLLCSSLGSAYAGNNDGRIIIRMSGKNRYETAIKASKIGWADGALTAIITNGNGWADAISGISLSTALDAPILLTVSDVLNPYTKAELIRLGVKDVIILGGIANVSASIEKELSLSYNTERISGANRYETSLAIARRVYREIGFTGFVLVTGEKFPDGLTAAPYAAANNMGMLICNGNSLSNEIRSAIKDWNIDSVTLIGGEQSVSEGIRTDLEALGIKVNRISGENRFITSVKTQEVTYSSSDKMVIINGEKYADALAGGSLAVKLNAPLVLVKKDAIPKEINTYIRSLLAETCYILGGPVAISEGVGQNIYKKLTSYRTMYNVVNANKTGYIYNEMMEDLRQLSQKYPSLTALRIIGQSEYGRDIPAIIIGNPNSDKKVLVHGGIHGREFMTTTLIMKQIEMYLHQMACGEHYKNKTYYDILDEVALYFVPMVNPDGVMLSQMGLNSISSDDLELRAKLIKYNGGSTDFISWKANINGVDINLNFDADWKKDHYFKSPNSYRYSGEFPFNQAESRLLRDITLEHEFDMSLSYHSSGEIIFWYYGQGPSTIERDRAIANQIAQLTTYKTIMTSTSNAMWGGYKDWYIKEYKKPGFTLEIGPRYASSPLDVSHFGTIWQDNQFVPIHLAYLTGK